MRSVWLAYWEAVESLGETLLSILARALGLPDEWFQPFINEGPSVMRANNYQRRAGAPPPVEGQQRMGAHTDYGSLTILLADEVPGLQIRDSAGLWHDIMPPSGGFLVNLGDLLAEWTNDRWRSTLHRVVPPSTESSGEVRRRSVAWFQQPNFDAMIEVLDSCCSPTNPARYKPISAGDHLIAKLMGPRTATVADVGPEFLHPE